jgi:hypothetical protein
MATGERSTVEERLRAAVDALPVTVADVAAVAAGRSRHAGARVDVMFGDPTGTADQVLDAGS